MVPRAPRGARRADPPPGAAASRARTSSRSVAAPATTFPCSRGFGKVDALELDDAARELAEKRLGRKIMRAPLPEIADVPDRHYDLIGAFDVIEHIDDDHAAVASIAPS